MSTQNGWGWAAPPQPPVSTGMTQADAFAVPGATGARWMGPPMADGHIPTEEEQNTRMWVPRFPPQQPFTGQGHRLGDE